MEFEESTFTLGAPEPDEDVIAELGLTRYRKTVVATVTSLLALASIFLAPVYVTALILAATAYGVYKVPNAS